MLRVALRWPRLLTQSQGLPETAGPATSDRAAQRFVVGIWLAMLALLLVFAAKTATQLPLLDEYYNVHLVVDPFGVDAKFYWIQHNEHRIPLPRLLFVAAVKLAGDDFRAPPFLNVGLLAAAAALLNRAVVRARGRYAFTDAVIPLIVMNIGQHDNLLWGFQVQFVSSTVLALFLLALVIDPRFADSSARIAAAGVIALLEPLCGANGVALVPAFSSLLVLVAIRNRWRGGRRFAGLLALLFGLAGFAMIPIYFRGLTPAAHHAMAKSWATVAENAVNFTAVGFGSVAFFAHGSKFSGLAEYGLAMLALLVLTGGLLLAHIRAGQHRMPAIGIGCVIGGVLCLGLGLAYGRGAMGGLLGTNRYTTLAMPLVIGVYVAWSLLPSRLVRIVPILLLAAAFAGLWTNAAQAFVVGKIWREKQARTEAEIRSGIPVTFVVDRHFHPNDREVIRKTFLTLREHRIGPFADLVVDPPLDESVVPIRIVRTDGLNPDDRGLFRVTGESGTLVLALPDRRHVYGFKLQYESESPVEFLLFSMVSWEPGGTIPPRPGYGLVEHLHPASALVVTHIFADRETDTLRIDLVQRGAAIRIHGLSVLTPRR